MRFTESSEEYESEPEPPSYKDIQTRPGWRWDWLRRVESKLGGIERNSGFHLLSPHINTGPKLGKGQYSNVYQVTVLGLPDHPVAMKRMLVRKDAVQVDHVRRVLTQLIREEMAYCYLNSLVLLNVCPGFPLLFDAFLSRRNKSRFTYYIFMECADRDMNKWIRSAAASQAPDPAPPLRTQDKITSRMLIESGRQARMAAHTNQGGRAIASRQGGRNLPHHDPWRANSRTRGNMGMGWSHIPAPKVVHEGLDIMSERVMHALLQVSMSVLAMVTHLDMINNDLYLKNILVNDITPCTFQYVLGDSVWTIRSPLLFKVSDFGICSSPRVLNKPHDDNSFFKDTLPLDDFSNFDFSKHILQYNIPPYARDILTFYYSVRRKADSFAHPVKKWLDISLKFLETCCQSGWMYEVSGVERFVSTVFSQNTITKCNLPSDIFWDRSADMDNAEVYQLSVSDKVEKSMEWMTRDRMRVSGLGIM